MTRTELRPLEPRYRLALAMAVVRPAARRRFTFLRAAAGAEHQGHAHHAATPLPRPPLPSREKNRAMQDFGGISVFPWIWRGLSRGKGPPHLGKAGVRA
jgi:hypothetical protein